MNINTMKWSEYAWWAYVAGKNFCRGSKIVNFRYKCVKRQNFRIVFSQNTQICILANLTLVNDLKNCSLVANNLNKMWGGTLSPRLRISYVATKKFLRRKIMVTTNWVLNSCHFMSLCMLLPLSAALLLKFDAIWCFWYHLSAFSSYNLTVDPRLPPISVTLYVLPCWMEKWKKFDFKENLLIFSVLVIKN